MLPQRITGKRAATKVSGLMLDVRKGPSSKHKPACKAPCRSSSDDSEESKLLGLAQCDDIRVPDFSRKHDEIKKTFARRRDGSSSIVLVSERAKRKTMSWVSHGSCPRSANLVCGSQSLVSGGTVKCYALVRKNRCLKQQPTTLTEFQSQFGGGREWTTYRESGSVIFI